MTAETCNHWWLPGAFVALVMAMGSDSWNLPSAVFWAEVCFPSPGQDSGRTLPHLLSLIRAPSTVQVAPCSDHSGTSGGDFPHRLADPTHELYRVSLQAPGITPTEQQTDAPLCNLHTAAYSPGITSLSQTCSQYCLHMIRVLLLHKDKNPDSLPSTNLQFRGFDTGRMPVKIETNRWTRDWRPPRPAKTSPGIRTCLVPHSQRSPLASFPPALQWLLPVQIADAHLALDCLPHVLIQIKIRIFEKSLFPPASS